MKKPRIALPPSLPTWSQARRQLVTQTLSPSRWHQHEDIPSFQSGLDDLLLAHPEGTMPEDGVVALEEEGGSEGARDGGREGWM